MKDTKYIIIIILALLLLGTGLLWLFGGNQSTKRENRILAREVKALQKSKDSLDNLNKHLENIYYDQKQIAESIKVSIDSTEEVNKKLNSDLKTSKRKLAEYRLVNVSKDTTADSLANQVITDCEELIEGKDLEINYKDSLIANQDTQITNLDTQVANHKLREVMSDKQLLLKDDIISNKNLQIRRLKTKTIIVGSVGGVTIAGLILGLIFIK